MKETKKLMLEKFIPDELKDVANNIYEYDCTVPEADKLLDYVAWKYDLEDYIDFADMCTLMSLCCRAMCRLIISCERDNKFDEIARANIHALDVLLEQSSKLWVNCDPYYRK